MKKKIVIIILAVCILIIYGQPESYQIEIENDIRKIKFNNGMLYMNSGFEFKKLIDEKIIDFKFYDIDLDGSDEILAITKLNKRSKYGDYLVIYDMKLNNDIIVSTEIYRQDFSDLKPWKIDACNLDNDSDADIFIGVNKDTAFYKDVRNRPFFYSWDGKKLYKKWQGSFFTDWNLVDITFGDYFNLGYDTAAVLEQNENDEFRVGVYSFTGFGFLNIAKSINYKDANSINTIRENNSDYVVLKYSFLNRFIKVDF